MLFHAITVFITGCTPMNRSYGGVLEVEAASANFSITDRSFRSIPIHFSRRGMCAVQFRTLLQLDLAAVSEAGSSTHLSELEVKAWVFRV